MKLLKLTKHLQQPRLNTLCAIDSVTNVYYLRQTVKTDSSTSPAFNIIDVRWLENKQTHKNWHL